MKYLIQLLIFAVIISSGVVQNTALPVNDPSLDIYPSREVTTGDLSMVRVVGSDIVVSLHSGKTSGFYVMILLNTDNIGTTSEAAIMVDMVSSAHIVYWYVGDTSTSFRWTEETSGYRVREVGDELTIWFDEPNDLELAEISILTLVPEHSGYYDWLPDVMEFNHQFDIFNGLIAPFSAVPSQNGGGGSGTTSTTSSQTSTPTSTSSSTSQTSSSSSTSITSSSDISSSNSGNSNTQTSTIDQSSDSTSALDSSTSSDDETRSSLPSSTVGSSDDSSVDESPELSVSFNPLTVVMIVPILIHQLLKRRS